VILPSLFAFSFLRGSYRPGVSISLGSFGQNALYVSTCAADAQRRTLPLITSDPSTHDGWMRLRDANLRAYDDVIRGIPLEIALPTFATALLIPQVLL